MAAQASLLKGNRRVERYSVLTTQSLPPLPPLQLPKLLQEMLAIEMSQETLLSFAMFMPKDSIIFA